MEIRAFRGWRRHAPDGDVGKLIAPPYDVLSPADKDALLACDERNIVAVDLPHVPAKQVGPDEAYRSAARRLGQWKSEGLLRPEPAPALYAYEQTFRWGGREYVRRVMVAAVRATELGEDVIPHEHTFAGPKADRLKLTQETRMQLSPIFGFFDDPSGAAAGALWSAAGGAPDAHGQLGGVGEKLWAVTDPAVIEKVAAALARAPVFIADGHHRYTTALNYRNALGQIAPDHPANFVMFVLAAMDDPGLIILPTHRVLSGLGGFDLARRVAQTADVMDYQPVELTRDDVADADAWLRGFGPHAMALVAGGERGDAYVATPKDLGPMARLAPDECDAWRELDVSILHRMLLESCLGIAPDAATEYVADGPEALAAARTGGADLVAFVQATPLASVKQIASVGAVMPHKSTYFYPKLATGMVLYPLEQNTKTPERNPRP